MEVLAGFVGGETMLVRALVSSTCGAPKREATEESVEAAGFELARMRDGG
jgi:hypothetical protein